MWVANAEEVNVGNIKSKQRKHEKPYHHGDLREALVAAGEEVLAEAGEAGLTLRAVAAKVGVTQAAPYRHFPDKDALLAAIAARGFGEFKVALDEGVARGKQPVEQLLEAGQAYLAFAMKHPARVRVMFRLVAGNEAVPELLATAPSAFNVLIDGVRRCQEAGELPAGDPLPLAMACWSMVHGLALLVLDGALGPAPSPSTLRGLGTEMLRVLMYGLLAPDAPSRGKPVKAKR